MATIQLLPDFKEFLKLLNDHGVKYLLIGGFAVAYHGYPRSTGDLDIWVAMDLDNAVKIVAVLEAFGFRGTGISTDLFLEPTKVTRMGYPPVRIEILTSISGVDFADAYEKHVVDDLDGISVPLIGLEHLKDNKRASGRPKDLSDLEKLP
jgi:predicted nucleotidyltransferase